MYISYGEEKVTKRTLSWEFDHLTSLLSFPDFPFPLTATYPIAVPGFENVRLKDESSNLTGTHKDRMAWEIVTVYRTMLLARKKVSPSESLPHFSLISSWSAAYAIQTLLQRYALPALKVLVDSKMDKKVIKILKEKGCEIYTTELSAKRLTTEDILRLTHNPDGFDITSLEALEPWRRFYEWLSYEIMNISPDYCFVPCGTGHLYETLLNTMKKEISSWSPDPRFTGSMDRLRQCHCIAVSSDNARTQAEKLYSHFSPFNNLSDQQIRFYKSMGCCGSHSGIYHLDETYLHEALQIAKKLQIRCEASGIAWLAMMLQMKHTIPRDKKVLIINTGRSAYMDLLE